MGFMRQMWVPPTRKGIKPGSWRWIPVEMPSDSTELSWSGGRNALSGPGSNRHRGLWDIPSRSHPVTNDPAVNGYGVAQFTQSTQDASPTNLQGTMRHLHVHPRSLCREEHCLWGHDSLWVFE